MSTLIIAEAGVNHNGDINRALEMVHAAALAGADLVKFQSFVTGKSIAVHAPKAVYQERATGVYESQFEMVRKLELSADDHRRILEECNRYNIGFFSTAFDEESLDLILEMNVDRIKVPSGEITNLPLLRRMAQTGLPVILSTGMANLGEIEAAIAVFETSGLARDQLTVLHCNTEYPTPMSDVNLRAMRKIGEAFGVAIGYSDHTLGIEVPIAAVALGATVIEKHLTLDRNLPGPDHHASLDPKEFAQMVSAIRNIELAIGGDGIKRASPSEAANKAIARKSIVATRDIVAGELFTSENLGTKRPGSGISPMRWDEVIGTRSKRSYGVDELIEL